MLPPYLTFRWKNIEPVNKRRIHRPFKKLLLVKIHGIHLVKIHKQGRHAKTSLALPSSRVPPRLRFIVERIRPENGYHLSRLEITRITADSHFGEIICSVMTIGVQLDALADSISPALAFGRKGVVGIFFPPSPLF
ncbi:hypothetical protein CDAR_562841 [Caerostris darwini]|uniref:Uncharacterized protein n=1 Tax=Caerostris darwini TaxID=1538125 RepID=A0AAV4X5W2_9ARAC|nr:hypothetical protein CDAR_562841 [Caerostris darwini]